MPTAKQLRESDAIILDKIESDTYCLTVYTNGYFMYRSGRRSTVRSVHNCQTPMVYHDANGNRESIGIDVFGELPYPIRLMFEGETLLEWNRLSKETRQSPYCDEILYTDQDDFTDMLLDKFTLEDVRLAMSKLPSRRRQILEMHFFQGLSRQEIAASLGIS